MSGAGTVVMLNARHSVKSTHLMKSGGRKYIILLALFALFMVNITFAGAAAPTCNALITSPSNAIADVGQYVSFTASESSCVSTFTYNVLVVNSVTPGTITHNDLLTGQTANSVTFTFQTVSADTSNSPEEANVVVTDSGTNTVTSGYSSNFIIHAAISTPIISPSNPTIDSGQSVQFTSTWSGGTKDYTAKLYSSSTSTCNTGSTLVQTQSSLISGKVTFNTVAPTSNTYYCIFVTDSASTPATVNSINSEVVVNPALSAPSISPSNPAIDTGQSVSFTSSWTIEPYIYCICYCVGCRVDYYYIIVAFACSVCIGTIRGDCYPC